MKRFLRQPLSCNVRVTQAFKSSPLAPVPPHTSLRGHSKLLPAGPFLLCGAVLLLGADLSERQTKSVAYANLGICSWPDSEREEYREFELQREEILFFSASLLTTDPTVPINESESSCLLCLRLSCLCAAFCPCFRHQVMVCFQLDKDELFFCSRVSFFFPAEWFCSVVPSQRQKQNRKTRFKKMSAS